MKSFVPRPIQLWSKEASRCPWEWTIPKNAIISSEDVGVQAKVPSTLPAASLKIISTALEFVYFYNQIYKFGCKQLQEKLNGRCIARKLSGQTSMLRESWHLHFTRIVIPVDKSSWTFLITIRFHLLHFQNRLTRLNQFHHCRHSGSWGQRSLHLPGKKPTNSSLLLESPKMSSAVAMPCLE